MVPVASHDLSKNRRAPLLVLLAVLCLTASWYYALAIVATAPSSNGPAFAADLYPAWYATRVALSQRISPYTPEVTRQIQAGMYGDAVRASQMRNQQRFAYPLYSVVFFAPFAAMPFSVAQSAGFVLCLALTALSVLWWLPQRVPALRLVLLLLFTVAAYPVVLGTLLRQPTLLVAPLLAAAVYCVRRGHLTLAGILGAFASIKPQLAIAVLLPLAIWAYAEWPQRKRLLVSLVVAEGALLAVAQLLLPAWVPQWLDTLRAYSQYAGGKPRLFFMLPPGVAWAVTLALVIAVVWVAWRWQERDLLFSISFSIAVFQLIFPFQMYNEVLLLPAVLWLLARSAAGRQASQLFALLRGFIWVVLGWAWVAMLGLSVANLLHPGSANHQPAFPMISFWLLPYAMLVVLLAHAIADFGRRPAETTVPASG